MKVKKKFQSENRSQGEKILSYYISVTPTVRKHKNCIHMKKVYPQITMNVSREPQQKPSQY